MPVDPSLALGRLVTVLEALAVTGSPALAVYTGAPDSLAGGVNAYATLDRWTMRDSSMGQVEHTIEYGVTFAYRIDATSGESDAETVLAKFAAAFVTAMRAERLSRLASTVHAAKLPDFSRAAEPQYAAIAGSEFRLYPGTVSTTHYEQD